MEGNQMKMREALNDIVDSAKIALNMNAIGNSNNSELWKIIDKCKSALSESPRNCDVGTADEQAARFSKFCLEHQAPWHGCTNCPVLMSEKCALTWSQMPYKARKGAKK